MKILIICSKQFYPKIEKIKETLESKNIEVFLPNCYDNPKTEERMKNLSKKVHQEFKAKMYKQSENTIKNMDAVLHYCIHSSLKVMKQPLLLHYYLNISHNHILEF